MREEKHEWDRVIEAFDARISSLEENFLEALSNGNSQSTQAIPYEGDYLAKLPEVAGHVHRAPRTLYDHYRKHRNPKKRLPSPAVIGGGGQPHFYWWSELIEWAWAVFRIKLPDAPPSVAWRYFR